MILSSFDILGLSVPGLQARGLKGSGEREGECEWCNSVDLVDFVQVDGRIFFRDSSTQESNSGHGRRNGSRESLDSQSCNFFYIRLVLAVNTANSHRRLQQSSLKHDSTVLELLVNGCDNTFLDLGSCVDIVVTVNQDFRFDDGDKSGFLADACVTGKSVGGLIDSVVGRESLLGIDAESSTPLGESSSLGVVKDALVVKSVQTGAPGLTFTTSAEGFESGVDLDTRDDSLLVQEINKRLSFLGILVESFFEKNGSRNAVTNSFSGEEELTPLEKKKETQQS